MIFECILQEGDGKRSAHEGVMPSDVPITRKVGKNDGRHWSTDGHRATIADAGMSIDVSDW